MCPAAQNLHASARIRTLPGYALLLEKSCEFELAFSGRLVSITDLWAD